MKLIQYIFLWEFATQGRVVISGLIKALRLAFATIILTKVKESGKAIGYFCTNSHVHPTDARKKPNQERLRCKQDH